MRKMIIELMLASHDESCTTCPRSGDCRLQSIAKQLGVKNIRFKKMDYRGEVDLSSPAIARDPSKCILCGDCVRVCDEIQSVGALGFSYRGAKSQVGTYFDKGIGDVECVGCGQCSKVCPVGALTPKYQINSVWDAIHDTNKTVVVQIAPAVRVALGEYFGKDPGALTIGRIITALRRMGFDRVYDTCFGADFTVVEEGKEFIERRNKGENLPMFTSCCPAWVRYMELNYPALTGHLSTCKSPQQMAGAMYKTYGAGINGVGPERMFSVSVMPCTCKSFEAMREEMNASGYQDVDAVITTRELAYLLKDMGIDFETLEDLAFDDPMGAFSGAGEIFGCPGGVMEAAIRTAYELLTGKQMPDVDVPAVRGTEGLRKAEIDAGGVTLKVGVVTGLKNAEPVIEALEKGKLGLHFVEVMTCPSGCVSGGGQPKLLLETEKEDAYACRRNALYDDDSKATVRKSHENPQIIKAYEDFLGAPLSEKAHKLLHS
jgi:iron-only hydrogenase group A